MAVTVKVLSGAAIPAKPAEEPKIAETDSSEKSDNIEFFDYPIPVRRRRKLSFGGVFLVQALISCIAVLAVWLGMMFGGESVRGIITEAAGRFI